MGESRLGQDHDRPGHRRADTRSAAARCKVLGHEMLGVKERELQALRQDIGFVFQDPATSFNPLLSDRASASPSR